MGATERVEDVVGRVLDGRFEVKDLLGEGGLGMVYRAHDRELGRDVALKILIPRYRGRPERESRLLAEAAMAQAVEHPRVVECLEWGRIAELEGGPYAVFEIVEGTSLNERLAWEGAFEPLQAAKITRELADMVQACHAAGLVHRDVSVQNVFMADGGALTLLDFSHAARIEDAKERATLLGEIPGTPWFMSPEQARGERATASMDVFAVGVLGYELLIGKNPYRNVQTDIFAELQGREEIRQPKIDCRVHSSVPECLAEVVNDALVLRAPERISLSSFMAKLDEAIEAIGAIGATEAMGGSPQEEPIASGASVSGSTMLMRRPPVIAQGARAAGDETMAQLVQGGVQMPSAKRVHAELEKVGRDEVLVVHKAQLDAVLGPKETLSKKEPETTTGGGAPNSSSEPVSQGPMRGMLAVLAAVLLAVSVAVAVVMKPSHHALNAGAWAVPELVTQSPVDGDLPADVTAPEAEKLDLGGGTEVPPETDIAPAPEIKPSPAPANVRRPRPGKKKTASLPTVSDVAAEDSEACVQQRKDAKRAAKSNRPRDVLRHTKTKRCWKKNAPERSFIRTVALHDLGEFDACARAGRSSKHPQARAYAKLCASKQ